MFRVQAIAGLITSTKPLSRPNCLNVNGEKLIQTHGAVLVITLKALEDVRIEIDPGRGRFAGSFGLLAGIFPPLPLTD